MHKNKCKKAADGFRVDLRHQGKHWPSWSAGRGEKKIGYWIFDTR